MSHYLKLLKNINMEWKLIDKNNLPKEEVLAGNFGPRTYGYEEKLIGCLYISGSGSICCNDDDGQVLGDCTHYIDINNYDPAL